MHADDVPARIDGDEGRPCADGIRAPDAKLAIVQRWMGSAQPNGGIADVRGLPLRRVLAAVNANHGEIVRKLLLELPQLREDMDAVDSAIGPEVQQQHPPAKVSEREPSSAGVDPVERIGEIGSANGWRVHGGMRVRSGISCEPTDCHEDIAHGPLHSPLAVPPAYDTTSIRMPTDHELAFPQLTAGHIAELTPRGTVHVAAAGEVLFSEGDRDFAFYVVLSGDVEIVEHSRA